jgi:hypothetical protein
VLSKTSSYTVLLADNGKLLTFSGSTSPTLTLPSSGLFNGWYIDVQNTGTGVVNLSGNTIDGAAGPDIDQNFGMRIFSDGTNYFSQRGMGQEVYNAAGTFQPNTRIFAGRDTLSSGTVTITLGGEHFTNATSYTCTVSGAGGTVSQDYRFNVTYSSGSQFVITSTSTISPPVGYICIGK